MAETELGNAWSDWISHLGEWHIFGALTYDPRRKAWNKDTSNPIPRGPWGARSDVRRWLRDGSKVLGRPIEAAVVALEYQKNGWPHFHPLLRIAGGLQGYEFRTLGGLWFRAHGYAKLEVPRSQDDVSEYASKYLMKDLAHGDVILWPPTGSLRQHQPPLEGAVSGDRPRDTALGAPRTA